MEGGGGGEEGENKTVKNPAQPTETDEEGLNFMRFGRMSILLLRDIFLQLTQNSGEPSRTLGVGHVVKRKHSIHRGHHLITDRGRPDDPPVVVHPHIAHGYLE